MAHLARLLIFFAVAVPGMWWFVVHPTVVGGMTMLVAFVVASALSQAVFKRMATSDQIRADLADRLTSE